MNGLTKVIVVALIAIYVLSPADAAPGPLDDFVVLALGALALRA